ncbi:hypothetical protein BHM03_00008241, partial [Ensete ventricosum]
NLPPKPWERAGTTSGPAPFKPPSSGSTSDVVEASGTAKPGEIVPTADRNVTANSTTLARPVPPRPWQNYGTSYGGNLFGSLWDSYIPSSVIKVLKLPFLMQVMVQTCIIQAMVQACMGGGVLEVHTVVACMAIICTQATVVACMEVLECMGVACTIVALVAPWVVMEWAWEARMVIKIQIIHMVLHHRHRASGCPFSGWILGIRTKTRKQQQLGPGELPAPAGQQYLEGPKAPAGAWDSVWGNDVKGSD